VNRWKGTKNVCHLPLLEQELLPSALSLVHISLDCGSGVIADTVSVDRDDVEVCAGQPSRLHRLGEPRCTAGGHKDLR
jgi:hypothetical protein